MRVKMMENRAMKIEAKWSSIQWWWWWSLSKLYLECTGRRCSSSHHALCPRRLFHGCEELERYTPSISASHTGHYMLSTRSIRPILHPLRTHRLRPMYSHKVHKAIIAFMWKMGGANLWQNLIKVSYSPVGKLISLFPLVTFIKCV